VQELPVSGARLRQSPLSVSLKYLCSTSLKITSFMVTISERLPS
jgi:hypothetical protein